MRDDMPEVLSEIEAMLLFRKHGYTIRPDPAKTAQWVLGGKRIRSLLIVALWDKGLIEPAGNTTEWRLSKWPSTSAPLDKHEVA